MEEIEKFKDEGLENEVEEIADETTEEVGDKVGNVGGAEAMEKRLKGFDSEAEKEGEEKSTEKAEGGVAANRGFWRRRGGLFFRAS